MSLLMNASHVNSTEALWSKPKVLGGNIEPVVGTMVNDAPLILQTLEYTGQGTYVIQAYFSFNSATNVPKVIRGYVEDNVSGLLMQTNITSTANGTYYTSGSLTIPNADSVDLTQFTTVNVPIAGLEATWSVVFYPS